MPPRVPDGSVFMTSGSAREARRYVITIRAVAIGILLFAAGEVAYAAAIGSGFLIKDGLDWIYDVLLYGMAAIIFGRGARAERIAALVGTAIMFASIGETIYDMIIKIIAPRQVEPFLLGFSALSTIAIVLLVVASLLPFRASRNPLIETTWLSARNDAIFATIYALFQFVARLAPMRGPELALDAFTILLTLQAIYVIIRDVRADAQEERTA
jgi:divalent metal cation (Fe/Co/Zn/Cd) transporter